MRAKPKNIKSNLKKVDAHRIKKKEYDELPELTDKMFSQAVYKVGGVKKLRHGIAVLRNHLPKNLQS